MRRHIARFFSRRENPSNENKPQANLGMPKDSARRAEEIRQLSGAEHKLIAQLESQSLSPRERASLEGRLRRIRAKLQELATKE